MGQIEAGVVGRTSLQVGNFSFPYFLSIVSFVLLLFGYRSKLEKVPLLIIQSILSAPLTSPSKL